MMQYPMIEPAPPEATDPHADGASILHYTIRHRLAPLVSPERYERALHAAQLAGRRRPDEHPATVAAIAQAQRDLAGALRRALAWEREQATQADAPPADTAPPSHNGNVPTHPPPATRPPATDYARPPAAPVAGGRMITF